MEGIRAGEKFGGKGNTGKFPGSRSKGQGLKEKGKANHRRVGRGGCLGKAWEKKRRAKKEKGV